MTTLPVPNLGLLGRAYAAVGEAEYRERMAKMAAAQDEALRNDQLRLMQLQQQQQNDNARLGLAFQEQQDTNLWRAAQLEAQRAAKAAEQQDTHQWRQQQQQAIYHRNESEVLNNAAAERMKAATVMNLTPEGRQRWSKSMAEWHAINKAAASAGNPPELNAMKSKWLENHDAVDWSAYSAPPPTPVIHRDPDSGAVFYQTSPGKWSPYYPPKGTGSTASSQPTFTLKDLNDAKEQVLRNWPQGAPLPTTEQLNQRAEALLRENAATVARINSGGGQATPVAQADGSWRTAPNHISNPYFSSVVPGVPGPAPSQAPPAAPAPPAGMAPVQPQQGQVQQPLDDGTAASIDRQALGIRPEIAAALADKNAPDEVWVATAWVQSQHRQHGKYANWPPESKKQFEALKPLLSQYH